MTRFWKLAPLVALAAAILLLLAGAAIGIYAERDYREQKVREALVQARILARALAAPLAFNDASAASNYVHALLPNEEIVAAAVYDAQGGLFASFLREGASPLPKSVEAGMSVYGDTRVGVAVPVVQKEVRLGTVYLRTLIQPLTQRLAQYIGLVLLGIMVLIVLGALGLAQAAVNRANAVLKRHADELEEANARLREQIAGREKAEEALRHAQKMESIGQLTGGVAHDFNNVLAIILGSLEMLERRVAEGADRSRLERPIANAKVGAERAAALIRSLLAFSRRQPLRPQPLDVNRLVSGMSELLRRTLGEQVAIETVVAGGLWRTLADPNQLENAILNLAVNARDAMPHGGKLTIETANAYLDARYTAEYEDVEPGQYVVLGITDTGSGMSKEVMERAFEPFYTTKDVGQGTGLGLSQVYGLVKQSGGHVKIYSEEGEGTTIKIYLPRLLAGAEAQVPAAPAEPALPEPAAAGPDAEAVLVVEDDDDVREHSAGMLSELGYPVFEARDGAEALRVLDEQPRIALLFTDVGLPGGMNGRALADEALSRRPDLKVLYTTGYARNAIVHDGRLDPGVHLVAKPFTYAELAEAVRRVLQPAPPEVLVVEDEFLLMASTVEDLADLGCTAIEAATAAEAKRALEKSGGEVAAAIVDLGLPDNEGDGIVAELRARWPRLRVIVASGAGADAIRPALAGDPMVSLLPKPYSAAQLEAALRRAGIELEKRA
jgi:signal transduction histidine kinase/CheY-like chemotaxis protein